MGKQGKNIMKRLLLFVLLITGFEKQLQPVSKIEVALKAVGTGIATTYAAWKVQKMMREGVHLNEFQKQRVKVIETLLAIGLGTSVGTAVYNVLALKVSEQKYAEFVSLFNEFVKGLLKPTIE